MVSINDSNYERPVAPAIAVVRFTDEGIASMSVVSCKILASWLPDRQICDRMPSAPSNGCGQNLLIVLGPSQWPDPPQTPPTDTYALLTYFLTFLKEQGAGSREQGEGGI